MNFRLFFTCVILSVLVACSSNRVKVKNEKRGRLHPVMKLEEEMEKKMLLDSVSAPKPQSTQIFQDSTGVRHFTFINRYDNSIYFYNYETLKFERKIKWERLGSNGIRKSDGYYIKSMDSIFVYNLVVNEIVLTNHKSKILKRISLKGKGDNKTWYLYYPQYYPKTVTPLIEAGGKLLFTGSYYNSLTESMLDNFRFNAQIDLKLNNVVFHHLYPKELYGFGSNWDGGLLTEVFPELHPDGDKLIYSFPVSHDLYITEINSTHYKIVYAGSNFAGTISSIDRPPQNTPNEIILANYIKNDSYSAIKYDKFRKVYYRFLLKGIPNATKSTKWQDKPIAIIIMDENFKYLGETVIGNMNDWNWENSFVTKEGLNIEYIEKDFKKDLEKVYLTLKIFTLKKL